MRIGRTATAFMTLAGLLLAGGGSALCTPAGHGVMDCCKPVRQCAPGMKAPDCCRFLPASTGQPPAAVESSLVSKISREDGKEVLIAGVAWSAVLSADVLSQASPPPLLIRDTSVPVYILNTSLLR